MKNFHQSGHYTSCLKLSKYYCKTILTKIKIFANPVANPIAYNFLNTIAKIKYFGNAVTNLVA